MRTMLQVWWTKSRKEGGTTEWGTDGRKINLWNSLYAEILCIQNKERNQLCRRKDTYHVKLWFIWFSSVSGICKKIRTILALQFEYVRFICKITGFINYCPAVDCGVRSGQVKIFWLVFPLQSPRKIITSLAVFSAEKYIFLYIAQAYNMLSICFKLLKYFTEYSNGKYIQYIMHI